MRSIHRSSFAVFVMVGVMLVTPALRAELRVASTVEVKAHSQGETGFLTAIIMSVMPFYLVKGKADVVAIVARGQVRIEGLGPVLRLGPDVVVLSRPDGETVYLLPASQTFFRTRPMPASAMATLFNSTRDIRSRGKSDVILGQQTERIVEDLKVKPGISDANPETTQDQFGRSVETWTLNETAEQRTARYFMHDRITREMWKDIPITIDSWISDGFGPAALTAAQSSASITALATAGFATLPDRKFALRQVITNLAGGYRVESRVTAIAPMTVTDDLFEIPTGYREVKAPPSSGAPAR